jgi:hypothetical protein
MLGLLNNQENQHEAFRRSAEGRGGFDIMRMRFTIVRNAVTYAETSPTIARAHENIQRAKTAAENLAYRQEVDRLAEQAELEAAVSAAEGVSPYETKTEVDALNAQYEQEAVPGSGLGLGDQAARLEEAQANINRIRSEQPPAHNYPLRSS